MIIRIDSDGDICRVVTRAKGSWRWQDAFGLSYYLPAVTKTGKHIFRSVSSAGKFAHTRATQWKWKRYGCGSIHNAEIHAIGVDDYGNQFFVV